VEPPGAENASWVLWSIVVVVLVIGVIVRRLWRRVKERLVDLGLVQIADRIEAVLAVLNDPAPHDLAVVSPERWPAPQRTLVEQRLVDAAAAGFSPLGDVEDRTVAKATGAWSTMRALVHADGCTTLTAVARPNQAGALIAAIECGSELSDGRFIETIATDEPLLDAGPMVVLTKLPASTSVPMVAARHAEVVQQLREGAASVVAVPVNDIDGLIQRAHRRLMATAAARAAVPGGISRAELASLAHGVEPALIDRLHQELIRREQARRRP
jgi:hypothetical protein